MKNLRWLLAGAALAVAGIAQAGVSATGTVVSDYDFRGISLSNTDPALQGSLDYAADNGFYVGIWGSQVDFGKCCNEQFEIDYYGGYGGGSEDGFQWGLYGVWYTDPGTNVALDYGEVNLSGTYQWFNAKLWYAWDYGNLGDSGYYADLNGTFPLPKDFGLVVHGGYSFGDYWSKSDIYGNGDGNEYYDYSIGITKSLGHANLALKFIDGSNLKDAGSSVLSTDAKIWASISTTFPWSSE